MGADYSRNSLNVTRKYSAVKAEQGRMLVDADWNEEVLLLEHRTETETRDVIGICGTPKHGGGFALSTAPSNADLLIGRGRFYVHGMMCELDPEPIVVTISGPSQIAVPNLKFDGWLLAVGQWLEITADGNPKPLHTQITVVDSNALTVSVDDALTAYVGMGRIWARRQVTYATQPFLSAPEFTIGSPANSIDPVQLPDGDYLAYVRAKKREVNALEDPHMRDVALGGPDTCVREETIWQVELAGISNLASPPTSTPDCDAQIPEWDALTAPMTGQMSAQTVPPPPNQNPCALAPQAGYLSLDNQLYRLEVFAGGPTLAQSTIVWSRDNGSVETKITLVDDTILTVTDIGKDDLHALSVNDWVEIVDPDGELNGMPRFLAQITEPPDPNGLTLKLSVSAQAYAGRTDLRLRRWDMSGPSVTTNGIPMLAAPMPLENGIQVTFSEGTYKTGAYWEIPARTATGDIEWSPYDVPNIHPIPQPPAGGLWKYCRLAIIEVRGGVWAVYDCRTKFPSLTSICADDVCYESACDDLKSAKTVQQALDEICHERDLRFHNKHLHGWGVVCGLEVVCGPDSPSGPREHVTVHSGYAIVCDTGDDVILDKDVELNVFDMIPSSPPGSLPADGDYSLILNSTGPEQFSVVPYEPDTFTSMLWNDSIAQDFYNDCIKNVVQVFTGAFSGQGGGTSNSLVSPAQQRIDTFTNLFAQYINPDTNSYIYLSGFQPNATPPTEDAILRDFYNQLRQQLQSDTFCAMFDKARQFPAYPFPDLKVSSIYGKGSRTNLRVDPTGTRLYAFGTDESIYVYNLATNQIDSIITFPASGAVVQDLAFSNNGSQLYAAAVLNNQDSIFAIAAVSGFTHTWQSPTTVICNILITKLGMLGSDSANVYALGRGNGIYKINIAAPSATPPLVSAGFPAYSHMVIDNASGFAYATSNSTAAAGTQPSNFDQVRRINLTTPGTNETAFLVGGSGTVDDGMAIVPSDTVAGGILFVTVPQPAGGTQQLVSFSASAAAPATLATVNIGESVATTIRLEHNPVTNNLMILCMDSNRVRLIQNTGTAKNIFQYSFPTEYLPADIQYNARANHVFILNQGSNTFSVVPPEMFQTSQQIDFNALLNYRTGVIDAFLDLIAGFAQYLKDCFCEQLLVKCPTCDKDDQLYLGTISIRSGQISKICNWTRRKYVKSFPTIGHWLSLVPIVPLLHWVVEKICCTALPEYFGLKQAPQPSPAIVANPTKAPYSAAFSGKHISGLLLTAKQANATKVIQSAFTKAATGGGFVNNIFQSRLQPPTSPAANFKTNSILGQSADASTLSLNAAHIQVDSVVQADPANPAGNAAQFFQTPASLEANSSATLVTDQNRTVVGVIPTSKVVTTLQTSLVASQKQITDTSTQMQQVSQMADQLKARLDATTQTLTANQAALTGVSSQITTLQSQITTMQASHAADLAAKDKQIADLSANLDQAQRRLATVASLQKQVATLTKKIG
jgi:hypothetical protein